MEKTWMGDDEDLLEFRINTDFADKYDTWRRKEELQKLKDRYGDDAAEPTSSSSESEDVEVLDPQLEMDFLKTLSYVKSQDPRIYKKDEIFYNYEENNEVQSKKKKVRKDQPMYLKDLERKLIVEKNGEISSDEDDEIRGRPWSPSYVEEQQMLKDSFKSALEDSDDEVDGTILRKKPKSNKEREEDEADYISWLKDQTRDGAGAPIQEMRALKQYWSDPQLDEGERFLRDYILNKGYMDKGIAENYHEVPHDEVGFSEEERLLEEQDDFERKYNFRFEEPDSDFIKRYPRTVAESVRRKDKKRSDKRQDVKTRKDQEKQKMKEDLKQLKNLKKKEIMEKVDKLKQVAGSVDFQNEDLEGDFDPEEHDKLMQKIFNDGYEENCGDETKPEFNDEELDMENWDDWNGDEENQEYGEQDTDNSHCEYQTFNMDADYVAPSQMDFVEEIGKVVGKKKRRRTSKFAQAIGRQKPVFNPDYGAFDAYIDEYYKLDYEDVVAGIPCRFKYRNVVCNDFGLTTDNILNAREKELNQWASLKKTCQYRSEVEEMKDVKAYSAKAKYSDKMKKVFTSLYSEKCEVLEEENPQLITNSAKQKDEFVNNLALDNEKCYAKTKHINTKKLKNHMKIMKTQHKGLNTIHTNKSGNELKSRKKERNSISKMNKIKEVMLKKRKQANRSQIECKSNSGHHNPFKKAFKNREESTTLQRKHTRSLKKRKVVNSAIDLSGARLNAYGINPKKHIYRMQFLAKLKSRKKRLQKK